jgi:hypothetical protein
MIYLGYLVAAILFALGVGILVTGWTTIQAPVLDPKNLLPLVQVAMAFIGAIAAAILTATVGRSNEYLRSELAQSVANTTENLKAALTESVNASTERLKADLTKSGDVFRAELNQLAPRRHAAYHAMWAALSQYFRAVQKFEGGIFDESALKQADKACVDASGLTLLVDKVDDETFHSFWQQLNFLYETAEQKRSPDDLRALWQNEARNLGNGYSEVRESFAARLRS